MKFIIEHLSKRFEQKEVLKDIDFTFEEGRIYGLLGRNGAGKTTAFNVITGVIKSPFVIDPEKCVKCYTCIEACPFDAIQEVEIDG